MVQLGHPPNRIDIITTISGVSFEEAWQGRQFGDLDGVTVPFLNKDCLIRNKRASGRDKDLEDLSGCRDRLRQVYHCLRDLTQVLPVAHHVGGDGHPRQAAGAF